MRTEATPPFAILSARQSGASVVYRLLATLLPGRAVGSEPFRWTEPLGEVSRRFHAGEPAVARELLRAALGQAAFFHHNFDAESGPFNQMLLDALADAGYRIIRVRRDDSREHLFSRYLRASLPCADAAAVARWRERLAGGHALPPIDAAEVRSSVQADIDYFRWFDAEFAARALPTLTCTHGELFRSGIAALATVDALFDWAGLPARAARLDDAAVLRLLFHGEHHTGGLRAYSDELAKARGWIDALVADAG